MSTTRDEGAASSPDAPGPHLQPVDRSPRENELSAAWIADPSRAGPPPQAIHIQVSQPAPIIIWGDRPDVPKQKPPALSGYFGLTLKVAAVAAVILGLQYGPSYLACYRMQARGMFYYGTTVSSCAQERLAERLNPLDAIARKILPVL